MRAETEDDLIILRAGDVAAGDNELIDEGAGQDTLILNGFSSTDSPDALPDPVTGGNRLLDIEQIQHVHVFPGFTSSEAAPAAFVCVNRRDTATATGVVFFNHDGAPLVQTVNGAPAQSTHSFTASASGRAGFHRHGFRGKRPRHGARADGTPDGRPARHQTR